MNPVVPVINKILEPDPCSSNIKPGFSVHESVTTRLSKFEMPLPE